MPLGGKPLHSYLAIVAERPDTKPQTVISVSAFALVQLTVIGFFGRQVSSTGCCDRGR